MQRASRTLQTVIPELVVVAALEPSSLLPPCSAARHVLSLRGGLNVRCLSYLRLQTRETPIQHRDQRIAGSVAEVGIHRLSPFACHPNTLSFDLSLPFYRLFSSNSCLYRHVRSCGSGDGGWRSTRGLSNKNAFPNTSAAPASRQDQVQDQPATPQEKPREKVVLDPKNEGAENYYRMLEGSLRKVKPVERPTSVTSPVDAFAKSPDVTPSIGSEEDQPLSLWARFKDMYKKYWYVLIPVHGVLCMSWYGFFYYLALRGFDVVPWLERMGLPEKILGYLKKSNAADLAAAFAMYKLATPLRYSVTLGATTVAINYLKKFGYIKPVPNASRIKQMIQDQGMGLRVLSKRGGKRLKRIRDKYKFSKKDR